MTERNRRSDRNERALTWTVLSAYAAPAAPVMLLTGSILIVLQGVYAKYYGIPLSTIAAIFLASRIFDAVFDPVIGIFADRVYVRTGSRKRLIVAGGLLLVISGGFLYLPPDNVGASYFAFWLLMYFAGFTLFDIPHLAWGSSLAQSSTEKTTLFGCRSGFAFAGSLLFFALPYLPVFESTEITPETLKAAFILFVLLIVPSLLLSANYVPNSRTSIGTTDVDRQRNTILHVLELIYDNKPFLWITAAQICTGIGVGIWTSLVFIFADSHLGSGEVFAFSYAIGMIAAVLSIPCWNVVNRRFGKRRVWAGAMIMVAVSYLSCGLLQPNNLAAYGLIIVIVFSSIGLAQFGIAAPSFVSDASDYSRWKFKEERSGSYFAIFAVINKSVAALGASFGLTFVGFAGFDPASINNHSRAVIGLYSAVSWLPALFFILSAFFILKIPLTERRNELVRRVLNTRHVSTPTSEV